MPPTPETPRQYSAIPALERPQGTSAYFEPLHSKIPNQLFRTRYKNRLVLLTLRSVQRLPKLAVHLKNLFPRRGRQCSPHFPVSSPDPGTPYFTRGFQHVHLDFNPVGLLLPEAHLPGAALDEPQFQDDVHPVGKKLTAVVQDQLGQPYFASHIPLGVKPGVRAICVEEHRKPGIQRNVHALVVHGIGIGIRRFARPDGPFDQVNLWHDLDEKHTRRTGRYALARRPIRHTPQPATARLSCTSVALPDVGTDCAGDAAAQGPLKGAGALQLTGRMSMSLRASRNCPPPPNKRKVALLPSTHSTDSPTGKPVALYPAGATPASGMRKD